MRLNSRHAVAFCLLTLLAGACASSESRTPAVPEIPGQSSFVEAKSFEARDAARAVRLYTSAAEQGYAPAYKRLGEMHYHGIGTAADQVASAHWFALASEAGDVEAAYNLGIQLFYGRGVARDPALAAEQWRKAGEKGYADAQTNLGALYTTGEGVALDQVQAAQWFRRAAETGRATGQLKLGLMYANGWGVEKNPGAALRWVHAAATQGAADAQHSFADYALGGFGMEADPVEAARWYWKAAQQANPGSREAFDKLDSTLRAEFKRAEPRGQRYDGFAFLEGIGDTPDLEAGLACMRLAANQDDPIALMETARCSAAGIGTAKDVDSANKACFRAAQLGYAPAQYEYGILHDDQGGYTSASHAEALIGYTNAAAKGHAGAQAMLMLEPTFIGALAGQAQAQFDLGVSFIESDRVRHDYSAARHWLTLASDQQETNVFLHITEVHLRLARLIAAGGDTITVIGRRTTPPDPVAAAVYYRRAANIGFADAQVELAKLLVRPENGNADLAEAIRWRTPLRETATTARSMSCKRA